jgi:cytochrome b561
MATSDVADHNHYSKLAISFHWITAALFLLLYIAVYYRIFLTERGDTLNLATIRIHTFCGVLVGLIAILRLVWRRISPPPDDVPGTAIEHFAARAVHISLYVFMIVMPLSGYLGLSVASVPLSWIGIPKFEDTMLYAWLIAGVFELTWEEFEGPVDWLHHSLGKAVVWVFILIHAAAALFHHFIRRDNTLWRMVPVDALAPNPAPITTNPIITPEDGIPFGHEHSK